MTAREALVRRLAPGNCDVYGLFSVERAAAAAGPFHSFRIKASSACAISGRHASIFWLSVVFEGGPTISFVASTRTLLSILIMSLESHKSRAIVSNVSIYSLYPTSCPKKRGINSFFKLHNAIYTVNRAQIFVFCLELLFIVHPGRGIRVFVFRCQV